MPAIDLPQGIVHYRDEGSGPPIVLIHGLLVDGQVWDGLVPALSGHARCIVPDLPLGSHRAPMRPGADLSPTGLAALIADLIARLELSEVTLVGNDTGGALCQLVVARHPERIGRLVLTNCDAFENFPPPMLQPFVRLLKIPGQLRLLELFGRLRPVRQASMSMMKLTSEPVPDPVLKSWIAPLRGRAIRRDLKRVLRGIDSRHTIDAEEGLAAFDRPALIVWGMREQLFPFRDAERLAATLPRARVEKIESARTFVQMDAPGRLAKLVRGFSEAEVASSRLTG
jgi:pimeloyl-ACP methyl ester carboxylesterase